MRRKMLLFVSLFLLFIGIKTVDAAVVCKYYYCESDLSMTESGDEVFKLTELKIKFDGTKKTVYKNDTKIDDIPVGFDVATNEDCAKVRYFIDFNNDSSFGYGDKIDDASLPGKKAKWLLFSLEDPRLRDCLNEPGKVGCGNITNIPKKFPELTSLAVNIVQVAVPVILVVMGSIDLFKGITAQKEDEIKKGQQIFIKRLIVAGLIFFVVVIVKLFIGVIADSSKDNISDCIDCFVSNDCN